MILNQYNFSRPMCVIWIRAIVSFVPNILDVNSTKAIRWHNLVYATTRPSYSPPAAIICPQWSHALARCLVPTMLWSRAPHALYRIIPTRCLLSTSTRSSSSRMWVIVAVAAGYLVNLNALKSFTDSIRCPQSSHFVGTCIGGNHWCRSVCAAADCHVKTASSQSA